MNIKQLEYLIAVAETGSLAKAAKRLFTTNTSVMNQIKALEKELGESLLDRSFHGVSLTAQGEFLYKEALKIVAQSYHIRSEIKRMSDDLTRQISIGFLPLTPIEDFERIWRQSPHISRFAIRMVSLNMDINKATSKTVGDIEFIDIAFGSEPSLDPLVPTETFIFHEYRVTCAVPVSHPLATKTRLTVRDLAGETILLPFRGNYLFASQFAEGVKKQGLNINVQQVPLFYDLELFNQCAREGTILLSCECWNHIHPEMVNLPVDWEWKLPYGLIYRKDVRPEVLEFVEAFKEAADSIKANY